MTTNIFEQASRLKLTVATPQGLISFMDLWDLPLTTEAKNRASLNGIAQELDAKLQSGGRRSFVDTAKSTTDPAVQLTFDIVLHIIGVRQAENAAARSKQEKAVARARIHELIATKKEEAMATKSVEELEKLLESLS